MVTITKIYTADELQRLEFMVFDFIYRGHAGTMRIPTVGFIFGWDVIYNNAHIKNGDRYPEVAFHIDPRMVDKYNIIGANDWIGIKNAPMPVTPEQAFDGICAEYAVIFMSIDKSQLLNKLDHLVRHMA